MCEDIHRALSFSPDLLSSLTTSTSSSSWGAAPMMTSQLDSLILWSFTINYSNRRSGF